jgi:hypothetical protein
MLNQPYNPASENPPPDVRNNVGQFSMPACGFKGSSEVLGGIHQPWNTLPPP